MYAKDYSDEFLDWVNTHFKKAMAVTQKINIDSDHISYVLMSTSGRKIKKNYELVYKYRHSNQFRKTE